MSGSEKSFINKYRPQRFEDVLGNEDVVAVLQRVLAGDERPHCYLLQGPSGVGKTTLARIIGYELGAEIREIDAASHSGIDDMRALVELSNYMSLQGSGNILYIIDECHGLSRNAWQALLKLTEEPPKHFYVALCTTEPDKVPDTIKGQRAKPVILKSLPVKTMEHYIWGVCQAEGWKPIPDVLTAILQGAEGSPRKALMMLLGAHDARNRNEVRRIIDIQDATDPIKQIGNLIVKGKPMWSTIQPYLAAIEDDEFAKALLMTGRYLTGAMLRARTEAEATRLSIVLGALTFPTETHDPKVRYYAVLARIIWGN